MQFGSTRIRLTA